MWRKMMVFLGIVELLLLVMMWRLGLLRALLEVIYLQLLLFAVKSGNEDLFHVLLDQNPFLITSMELTQATIATGNRNLILLLTIYIAKQRVAAEKRAEENEG